ncbi:Neutrophil cytosol factor 2 [Smittium culicis]|uniref:Neutrophil cytosol factor 2 n=1 Tax=Smittium culicis TaxID=133412 RepID=A0A1R1XPC4_9FUNG|nr:Neutrophil cytosol factor 2 [Smittium culicis]OMJ26667.1 Neutrophil cytosol factor 2 [Smittium culicis]
MKIADSSKVHFNIGLILSQKGENNDAINAYLAAINLDQYLAVAYFQKGVANMIIQNNAAAFDDFNDALLNLRGNDYIDYSQVDLNYKIFACEIIYNRALCLFCLNRTEEAINDLTSALKIKSKDRHSWIDKALKSNGVDCPLFCVPKGTLYKPSASKVQSTKKVDYLGNARLIAHRDSSDSSVGFKGAVDKKLNGISQTNLSKLSNELGRKVSLRDKPSEPVSNSSSGNVDSRNNAKPNMYNESSQMINSSNNLQSLNNSSEIKNFPSFTEKNDPNNSSNEGTQDGASHPDPLDIIKAGLARRVTLNKNRQNNKTPSPDPNGNNLNSRPPVPQSQQPPQPSNNNYIDSLSRNGSPSPKNRQEIQPVNTFNSMKTSKSPVNDMNASITNPSTNNNARTAFNAPNNYGLQIESTPYNAESHNRNDSFSALSNKNSNSDIPVANLKLKKSLSPSNQVPAVYSPLQNPISPDDVQRIPITRGKMKVKFHFESEIYNLVTNDAVDFNNLRLQINNKISKATGGRVHFQQNPNEIPQIKIRFVDEDNEQVLMTDSDDYELAKGYAGGDMSSSQTNVISRIEFFCSL